MARLISLKVEHYKGFFDEQTIEFAEPNGNAGSGLTLIVGPNNTGKTTVIESLLLKGHEKFKETERHGNTSPIIQITSSEGCCRFSKYENGAGIRVEGRQDIIFEVIQSRRFWGHYFNEQLNNKELAILSAQESSRRNENGLDIAGIFKYINSGSEKKNKFNEFMKELVPSFTNWTIDANDRGDYVKYESLSCDHHANILGEGMISLFRICAHLVNQNDESVLIIDEPELSLHPTAQKSLSNILSSASSNRQIILCTHSPYFANWEDLTNGAKFIRLNKVADRQCEVFSLNNESKYSNFIGNNINEWQKPQILDVVAKEILFTEKILFVEGQEDVGLIRKWLKENKKEINFDIFGYGVGGYSNMSMFLSMAKDLGLGKVAALYDSGPDADLHFEEDEKKYPDYCFEKLPTSDIRDKKVRENPKRCLDCEHNSSAKIGMFNVHGEIKEEYRKEMNSIEDNFIDYFSK